MTSQTELQTRNFYSFKILYVSLELFKLVVQLRKNCDEDYGSDNRIAAKNIKKRIIWVFFGIKFENRKLGGKKNLNFSTRHSTRR